MATECIPRPRAPIALAEFVGDITTGQVEDGKDPATAEMGRKGAAARASFMTPERRAEVARAAACKRWAKTDQKST